MKISFDKSLNKYSSMHLLTRMMYFPSKGPKTLCCSICKDVAFSPINCKICKAVICFSCLNQIQGKIIICPLCSNNLTLLDETEKNLTEKKMVLKKCKYFNEGCQATLNEDMISYHELQCDYQPFNCPNEGCTASRLRKKDALLHHLECDFSFYVCKECKQKIKLIDHQKHLKKCSGDSKDLKTQSLKKVNLKSLRLPKLDVCSQCKRSKFPHEFKKCSNCQKNHCHYCLEECTICAKFLCPKCSNKCQHLNSKSIPTLKLIYKSPSIKTLIPIKDFSSQNKLSNLNLSTKIMEGSFPKNSNFNNSYKNRIKKNVALMLSYISNRNKLVTIFDKLDNDSLSKINYLLSLRHSLFKIDFCKNKIDSCEIEPNKMAEISGPLAKNKCIAHLDFESLQMGPRGASILSKALKQNSSITFINLKNNSVGSIGVRAISHSLEVNRTIKIIDFQLNSIDSIGMKPIGEALKVNNVIRNLYFSSNPLRDDGIVVLCEKLQKALSLEVLSLKNCEFTKIGGYAIGEMLKFNKSIQSLNLDQNLVGPEGAKKISEALEINTTLKELQLDSNEVGCEGAKSFAEALKKNQTLEKLDLSKNKVTEEGAHALSRALKINCRLQRLDFSSNKLGENGLIEIFKVLSRNNSLKEIALWNCEVKKVHCQLLSDLISTKNTLEAIYLYENNIDDESIKCIAEGISHSLSKTERTQRNKIIRIEFEPNLKEKLNNILKSMKINLRENQSQNELSLEDANIMADIIRANNEDKVLDAKRKGFHTQEIRAITDALKLNSNLTELDFRNNKISDVNASDFGEIFKENKKYTSINFSDNPIFDTGIKFIVNGISFSTSIEKLYLWNCKIGPLGGKFIGNMLKNTNKLKLLCLDKNFLSAIGSKYIGGSLKINKTLEELQIESNKIGNEGAKYIANGLILNKTLKKLDLGTNLIDMEGSEALGVSLKENNTLTNLELANNNIGVYGAKELSMSLKENTSIQTLSLCNINKGKCKITSKGANFISDLIGCNSVIKKIFLCDNKISKKAAHILADGLLKNMQLKGIKQISNEILDIIEIEANILSSIESHIKDHTSFQKTSEDYLKKIQNRVEEIIDDIKDHRDSQILDLHGKKLGSFGIKSIYKIIENRRIKILNLKTNLLDKEAAFYILELLSKNKSFEEVNFSNNPKLTDEGVMNLIEGIKLCKTIRSINLSNCNIGPNGAFCISKIFNNYMHIQYLNLNFNYIQGLGSRYLSESIEKNLSLEELYLDSNKLGCDGAENFAECLKQNKNIKSISISQNEINAKGLNILFSCLVSNNSLISLDVSNNNIEGKPITSLNEFLSTNSSLKFLCLANCEIGKEGADNLSQGLSLNKGLETIILSKNKLGKKSISKIANSLIELYKNRNGLVNIYNLIQIEEKMQKGIIRNIMNIEKNNEIHKYKNVDSCGKEIEEYLSFIKFNSQLTNINLSRHNLGDGDIELLASKVEKNSNIIEIDLSLNKITSKGVPSISILFNKFPFLKVLNLSNNPIEDKGLNLLSGALIHSLYLKELILKNINLSPDSFSSPLTFLYQSNSLHIINFGNNNIQQKGVRDLIMKIKNSNSIISISLTSNYLKNEGLELLGKFMEVDLKIKILDISNNEITEEGVSYLSNTLNQNKTLEYLSLSNNNIGDKGITNLNLRVSYHLKQLILDKCHLTNNCAKEIKFYIEKNKFIEKISFFGNFFNELGAEILGDGYDEWCKKNANQPGIDKFNLFLIESNILKIIHSRLSFPNVKVEEWNEELITDKYLEAALDKLKDSELKYKSLILCNKKFKEQTFKYLCSFLENCETLEELIFERNSCNPQMITELMNSINLKVNAPLKKLSFSFNTLSEDQLKNLTQGLKSKSSLFELYLKNCQISMNSGTQLNELITEMKFLKILDLESNEIQYSGIQYFFEGLIKNKSIIQINLGSNLLKDESAQLIAQVLRNNKQIRKIVLSNNGFSAEGAKILSNALKGNKSLFEFDISYNPIQDLGAKFFSEATLDNKALKVCYFNNCEVKKEGLLAILESVSKNLVVCKFVFKENPLYLEDIPEIKSIILKKLRLMGIFLYQDSQFNLLELDEKLMKKLNSELIENK